MTPIIVATAVIGTQTDRLQSPIQVARDVPYVCFSDQAHAPSPWVVQAVPSPSASVWTARAIKLRLHTYLAEAAVSVWHDAAYQLSVDPHVFLPLLAAVDVLMLPHPDRQTVAQEAATLQRLKVVPDDAPIRQAEHYQAKGLPALPRLASTGLLIRRHSPHVNAFSEYWWEQLVTWGHPRDQMSVNYAAWTCGVRIGWLEGDYRDNPYAQWRTTARSRCVRPMRRRA